jgi:hypothetical protein
MPSNMVGGRSGIAAPPAEGNKVILYIYNQFNPIPGG